MAKVHLEIIDNDEEVDVYIDGSNKNILAAWMHLTVLVADTVKMPLPVLLAMCSSLEGKIKDSCRKSEKFRIDLSHLPRKE